MLDYDLYIFDFDGTIFDTNKIKNDAFECVIKEVCPQRYLRRYMKKLNTYNEMTRRIKFDVLADVIEPECRYTFVEKCIKKYESIISESFMNAEFIPGAANFLKKIKGKRKFIVSGGKESEIAALLKKHSLLGEFEAIYDGEKSKFDHFFMIKHKSPGAKRLSIGDSKLDYSSSIDHVNNFVFVQCASQEENTSWFRDNNAILINDFRELI